MASPGDDTDDWKGVSFSRDFIKKVYINGMYHFQILNGDNVVVCL